MKEDDKELEERHLEVFSFIKEEDRESLEAEEKAYDAHGNCVMELRERLEELEEVEKTESPPTTSTHPTAATHPSGNLLKRLKYLEHEKTAIVELTRTLPAEPVPHTCLCLQKGQEDISALSAQLSGLVGEQLSLTEGDTAALMDGATSIKRDLFKQDFVVRRLLLEI